MGDEARTPEDEPLVTKTGKVLADADIEALAAEAERGYCVVKIGTAAGGEGRRRGDILCGRSLPCPVHP